MDQSPWEVLLLVGFCCAVDQLRPVTLTLITQSLPPKLNILGLPVLGVPTSDRQKNSPEISLCFFPFLW